MYRKWGLPAITLLSDWLNKVDAGKGKKSVPRLMQVPLKGG